MRAICSHDHLCHGLYIHMTNNSILKRGPFSSIGFSLYHHVKIRFFNVLCPNWRAYWGRLTSSYGVSGWKFWLNMHSKFYLRIVNSLQQNYDNVQAFTHLPRRTFLSPFARLTYAVMSHDTLTSHSPLCHFGHFWQPICAYSNHVMATQSWQSLTLPPLDTSLANLRGN